MKKHSYLLKIFVILLGFAAATFAGNSFVSADGVKTSNKVEIKKTPPTTDAEILALIDKYQAEYFTIVKRNDLFLDDGEFYKKTNDRKELDKLYKTVENQITVKTYLKKYKAIEKRYEECTEMTTAGMNEFAIKNYEEVDGLLNEVYKKVKAKISPEDFKKLNLSERKWLKEVDDYQKVFDAQGYGTIGTIIYYTYQTDMRNFRTLLLMLFL